MVEHTIDPGERVDDHFAVRNISDQAVTFRLSAADGFYTRTGRFDMLPAGQESVGSGTWITVADEVTIPAGETAVIPFEVAVPEKAEPGDHAAGITASVLSTQSAEDGTSVGVESRIGFKVLTRVTGELAPLAVLQSVKTSYDLSWNPLRPGSMTVSFDVLNDGNTTLIAEGAVSVAGQQVSFPSDGDIRQELLPGDTREISVVVDDVWPLFFVPTTVTITPTMRTMGGEESTVEPISTQTWTVAIPWPQLIILLGFALVLFAVFRGRIRSRRKVAALVEEARQQGRLEASERQSSS